MKSIIVLLTIFQFFNKINLLANDYKFDIFLKCTTLMGSIYIHFEKHFKIRNSIWVFSEIQVEQENLLNLPIL